MLLRLPRRQRLLLTLLCAMGALSATSLFADVLLPPGVGRDGQVARELLVARLAESQSTPQYLGSQNCLYCHESQLGQLSRSHPAMLEFTEHSTVAGHSCETCHGPGSIHAIGGANPQAIVHPLKLPAETSDAICLQCHADTNWGSQHDWMVSAHADAGVACVTCHDPHTQTPGLLRSFDAGPLLGTSERMPVPAGPLTLGPPYTGDGSAILEDIYSDESRPFAGHDRFCLSCHTGVALDFKLRSNHPLDHGGLSCTTCHNPHTNTPHGADLIRKTNGLCESCHVSYSGPFVFPHPPVHDVGMGDGCLTCHQPHGSSHDQLLIVDGRGACLQCHVDMDSTGPDAHFTGSCWAAGCHTQVHGSHTNIYFLEEEPLGLVAMH